MLIGKYLHQIDIKKRISLPSKWRLALSEKIIITSGLDKALYLYSEQEWEKIADTLNANNLLSEDARNISRYIYSNAFELTIDSHGRVLLPEHLIKYAKLSDEAILAGSYNRVEIWNPELYQSNIQLTADNVNVLATRVMQDLNNKKND
jgi:MraZ protein